MAFKNTTSIKNLEAQFRLPRLGKIHLGVTLKTEKGVEYPKETDYFVCPPEVIKVYGEQPKELDILFPVEDVGIVSPYAYEWYGQNKLKCRGDFGINGASRRDDKGGWFDIDCPCEHLDRECKQHMHLRVMLPKVNVGGIYQIDTISKNSIVDVISALTYIKLLIGRIAFVPLKLVRHEMLITYNGKATKHWPLKIISEFPIERVRELKEENDKVLGYCKYSLPPPTFEEININTELPPVENAKDVVAGELPATIPGAIEKDYLTNIIYPTLRDMGLTTKKQIKELVAMYGKSDAIETLHIEVLESIYVFIQEHKQEIMDKFIPKKEATA